MGFKQTAVLEDGDKDQKKALREEISALGGKSQGLKTVEKLQERLDSLKLEQESTED